MDRTAIDKAYDSGGAFPDVPRWRERWAERSGALSLPAGSMIDVAYGPHDKQKIDCLPVGDPAASTVLFFHGGFWTRNSKETFRFLASSFARVGANSVFAGYRLAPEATLDEIVADARAARLFVQTNATALGLAERPLILVGWSVGAQLVAMLADDEGIAGSIAISGLYDLEPMRIASINDTLKLDHGSVARNSPLFNPPRSCAPLIVAYGGLELPEFVRQSVDFHDAWKARGLPLGLMELEGRHHHSVLDELYLPEGRLTAVLADMLERAR
jgi:arylformamidase